MSNYVTKTDIKNVLHVDNSRFASESNLASLKTDVDQLNINKFVPVSIDLSKLSDVIINVVKKTVFDKLVAKVSSIGISRFLLKTKYNTDKLVIENKITDTSGLVKKADYNAKITEIKDKRPYNYGLATNAALTTVEHKMPNISSLVKRK